MTNRTKPPFASRFYSELLRLYPRAFRARFGAEMLQTFEEYYADVQQQAGLWQKISFWPQILTDLGRSLVTQHFVNLFRARSSTMLNRKLSLIIPAYNEAETLERTVTEALQELAQSFKEQEVIIVNDGSNDATGRIAEQLATNYPAQIKVIHNKVNRGYQAALKSGIQAATGEQLMYQAGREPAGIAGHVRRLFKAF